MICYKEYVLHRFSSNAHLEEMLKFVQNNEEFAQKLTTPIWWGNQILFLISKKL
jgi:hypothetical protein